MKRTISVFLTLTMLLSCFAIVFTASAAGGVNTGTRHELCINLSAKAAAYYSGEYTWDSLSVKTGGNSSCLKSMNTPLFNALNKLMASTNTNSVSYNSLTSYWPTTDASAGSNDASLFYSDMISSSYNREHVWPKSRASFLKSNGGSDLHHLRPTNSDVNSTRGNHTMGNVRGVLSNYKTYEYGGKTVLYYDASYKPADWEEAGIVEVNDNIKGDVARILLYVWCRWKEPNLFEDDPNPVLGPGDDANNGYRVIESLDTLLAWCENDPVDTWEMSRNDCCADIQGNRNVFIDYPEYAWLLFGQEVPDMDTPSGMAHEMQSGTSYTITAVSSNEMMGTVSGSGRSYTAYPAEGYYVAGYSLVPSDAATVTQTGNTFTLTKLNADCTLIVNFAAKTPATLSFSVPAGVSCKAINAYAGDSVKLPTPSGVPTGEYTYSFKGWVASVYDNVTDKPATIYPAGSDYTLNGNTTLYALYTYSVGGTGSSMEFTKITTQDELTNGSYVFTSSATGKAMKTDVGSNWVYPGGTYTGDTIDTPAPDDIWEYADGKIFYTGGALTCSTAKSIALSDEGTPWTITAASGVWTLVSNGNTLSFNNTGWRPYGNGGYGNDKTFYVYKAGSGGTMYYTTLIGEPCEHNYVPKYIEQPTCTEPGYTVYICTLCDSSYQADETPALGHDFVNGICSRCGEEEASSDCPCIDFTDIDREAWYHTAVDFVIEKGIMGSTSTESLTFEPMTKVSRSMVASILYRIAGEGEEVEYQGTFTDVAEGVWYTNAIEWCAANGLASGKGEGIFDPDGNVTRQELAMFFYKLAEFQGEDMEKLADLAAFPDNKDVSDWAKTALAWCVNAGIISGKADLEDNKTLNPLDTAMRCEFASILMRYFAK